MYIEASGWSQLTTAVAWIDDGWIDSHLSSSRNFVWILYLYIALVSSSVAASLGTLAHSDFPPLPLSFSHNREHEKKPHYKAGAKTPSQKSKTPLHASFPALTQTQPALPGRQDRTDRTMTEEATTTPYFILLFAILYFLIEREERLRPCKSLARARRRASRIPVSPPRSPAYSAPPSLAAPPLTPVGKPFQKQQQRNLAGPGFPPTPPATPAAAATSPRRRQS